MPTNTVTATRGAPNVIAWPLQVLLALVFLAAAGAKFAGVPMMVQTFDATGWGQGFRYITAAVEIIGAIGLLLPRTAALAGLWLAATMIGATIAHLVVLHISPAPPLILLFLCIVTCWLRRDFLLLNRVPRS